MRGRLPDSHIEEQQARCRILTSTTTLQCLLLAWAWGPHATPLGRRSDRTRRSRRLLLYVFMPVWSPSTASRRTHHGRIIKFLAGSFFCESFAQRLSCVPRPRPQAGDQHRAADRPQGENEHQRGGGGEGVTEEEVGGEVSKSGTASWCARDAVSFSRDGYPEGSVMYTI